MQSEFMALRERYYSAPNKQDIMDEIIKRYFAKLIDGFWERHSWRFKYLEEHAAKAEALVQCFIKFDNYDPNKGKSYSYFTEVISNVFFHGQKSEALYRSRFINETSFDVDNA